MATSTYLMQSTPKQQAEPGIIRQCLFCGVIMDGALAGFYPTNQEGLVALLAGPSLVFDQCGQCPPCQEDWLK